MSRAFLMGMVLALVGCAATLETVYVPAENKGWKVGSGTNKPGTTLVEFIPTEESISNWTRLFTIQFLEGTRDSPEKVMETLQARMRARCPDVQWMTISENASSILYQWSISNCAGQMDQIEIARLLSGNEGVHRISFARKGSNFASGEKEKWLDAFSKAYVVKDFKPVVVTR